MARYGSGKNANSGNKRTRLIKNKVAKEKNITQIDPTNLMDAHEKMMALFKDEGFDISDPNGLVILNSRNNFKQYGSARTESTALTNLLKSLHQQNVFGIINKKTSTAKEMVTRAVDLNDKIAVNIGQKTHVFSSQNDVIRTYEKFKELKAKNGKFFIFDTETFGGKETTGIWNPLGITEFSMREINMGDGVTKKTNVVLGVLPNKKNTETINHILQLLKSGKPEDYAKIESNNMLKVTASRLALYADAEFKKNNLGYYEAISLPESEGIHWKSYDKVKKGYDNLVNVWLDTDIDKETGLKSSVKYMMESLVDMNNAIHNNTGMAGGQNFVPFDMPIVNMQIRQFQDLYSDMANGVQDVISQNLNIKLGGGINVPLETAQKMIKKGSTSMNKYMNQLGGSLSIPTEYALDYLPVFRMIRDHFGINAMYLGDKDAIKAAGSGTAKQENVAKVFFKDFFDSKAAHMADADTEVLQMMALTPLESLGGVTPYEYYMEHIGGTGLMGLPNNIQNLQVGKQLFYASKSPMGDIDFGGHGQLNHIVNEDTGEMFFASGHQFVNGKYLQYDPNINWGHNIKKGQFYFLDTVEKLSANDLSPELYKTLPDMSGGEFYHVVLEMATGDKNKELRKTKHHYYFNSEKQLAGFFSNGPLTLAATGEKGAWNTIVPGMEDLFDIVELNNNKISHKSKAMGMTPSEMIKDVYSMASSNAASERAYNSIISGDKAYKNTKKIIEMNNFLKSKGIKSVTKDNVMDLFNGNPINKSMTPELAQEIQKFFLDKIQFNPKVDGFNNIDYFSTRKNIAEAWGSVVAQGTFYEKFLAKFDAYAETNKLTGSQKNYAYTQALEALRLEAAMKNSGLNNFRNDALGVREQIITQHQLKSVYDVRLPKHFDKSNSRILRVNTLINPEENDEIFRINLSDKSYKIISNIRERMFGNDPNVVDKTHQEREAIRYFVNEILSQEENFMDTKQLLNLQNVVKEKDFNPEHAVNLMTYQMSKFKEKNPATAYLKTTTVPSLVKNIGFNKELNELSEESIDEALAGLTKTIDSHNMNAETRKKVVKEQVLPHFMPDKKIFEESIKDLPEAERKQRLRLFKSVEEGIENQLNDVLNFSTKIPGGSLHITAGGDIGVMTPAGLAKIKSIPKVRLQGKKLYAQLGEQRLNLGLKVGVNKAGIPYFTNNLGKVFEYSSVVSKRIEESIHDGTYTHEKILSFTNRVSKELREEAGYSGTATDELANLITDTQEFDPLIPKIFGRNGQYHSMVDNIPMPIEVKRKLADIYDGNEEIVPNGLDPIVNTYIMPFRTDIMREYAKYRGVTDQATIELIDSLTTATKDKSKLGKQKLIAGNQRYQFGFWNAFDDNSRPVVYGAGNAYYLDGDTLDFLSRTSKGTFLKGGLFGSDYTHRFDISKQEYDGVSSFSGRSLYISHHDIVDAIKSNFDDLVSGDFGFADNKEVQEEAANALYALVSTFEQAKVFDAETIEKVTGEMSAKRQILSMSKDLETPSSFKHAETKDMYERLWRIWGALEVSEDMVSYKSSIGAIVSLGEAIAPYAAFGGAAENWTSKVDKGVLKLQILDENNVRLTDDKINKILKQNKDRFIEFRNNQIGARQAFMELFSDLGYKTSYVVEDINKTTLPKILANDSEKSMNQLIYARIGAINENVRQVLELMGPETQELIGRTIPTTEALDAYLLKDPVKLNGVLKKAGFDNYEEFLYAAKQEALTPNRMLFGKGGLFEGFMSVGNDNIAGHGNKGTMMQGAIGEAVRVLGITEEGEESFISHLKGVQQFVEGYNANENFQFFKDQDGKGIKLDYNKETGQLILEGGASLQQGLDNYTVTDAQALEDYLRHIDEGLKIKGVSKENRLVHEIYDDKGNYQGEYVGGMAYLTEGGPSGSTGLTEFKIMQDSETESFTPQEYIDDKIELSKLKQEKRKALERQRAGEDVDFLLDEIDERMAPLERRIMNLEHTKSDPTKMLYRIDDQMRDIMNHTYILSDEIIDNIKQDIRSGTLSPKALELEGLRGLNVSDINQPALKFMTEQADERIYYDPLIRGEQLLTKDMVTNDKRYQHLSEIYDNVTGKMHTPLGVDRAQEIYDLQMVDLANKFNRGETGIEDLKAKGFEVLTPEEYRTRFSDMNASLPKDAAVHSNVILDLGEEFGSVNGQDYQHVAIPGMGSVVGDSDIKKDWHKKAGSVVDQYNQNYATLLGSETNKKEIIENITKAVDGIKEATNSFTSKNSTFINDLTKGTIASYTFRNKTLSTPAIAENHLLQKAEVGGHKIAELIDEGIFHDYEFYDADVFERAGYFKPEFLEKQGMTREQMEEFLSTKGTMIFDDRYPNIIDTSGVPVHAYLNSTKTVGQARNASLVAPYTMLKMNADSDGDSGTKVMMDSSDKLQSYDPKQTSFLEYNIAHTRAIDEIDAQKQYADEVERQRLIKQATMDQGISEKTYDDFYRVEKMSDVTAVEVNPKVWAKEVVKTNLGDQDKTRKAQTIGTVELNEQGDRIRKNLTAEVAGGTSVLGREKLPSLSVDPTQQQIAENLANVNDMLAYLQRDEVKQYLDQDKYKDILIGGTDLYRDFDNESVTLDKMLTAYQDLQAQGKISSRDMADYEKWAKQRVRINNYQIEAVSKVGITATGNTNVTLAGITREANRFYARMESDNYNLRNYGVITAMNYELEQAPISSKHSTIKAGNERNFDFTEIWNKVKREGLGRPEDGPDSNYNLMKNWMMEHMPTGKVAKRYNLLNARTKNPGRVLTDEMKIKEYMVTSYLEALDPLMRNDSSKQNIKMYSVLGKDGSKANNLNNVGIIESDSLTSKAVNVLKNQSAPEPKTQVPYTEPKVVTAKPITKVSNEASESLTQLGGNIQRRLGDIKGHGAATSLAVGALSLAAGLIAAGYASGNPLNDANPEKVAEQQTNNNINFGPETPQIAPNNTGGYIINIKGDTKKGNRQLKRAMKQAANNSVGGGVNVNMSLRTSQAGGYSDKDIEEILNDYL